MFEIFFISLIITNCFLIILYCILFFNQLNDDVYFECCISFSRQMYFINNNDIKKYFQQLQKKRLTTLSFLLRFCHSWIFFRLTKYLKKKLFYHFCYVSVGIGQKLQLTKCLYEKIKLSVMWRAHNAQKMNMANKNMLTALTK